MTTWAPVPSTPKYAVDGMNVDNPPVFLNGAAAATLILWVRSDTLWNFNLHLFDSLMFDVQREGAQTDGRFYVYVDGNRTEIESALVPDVWTKISVVFDGSLAAANRIKAYVGLLGGGAWGADALQDMGEGVGSAPAAFGVFATAPNIGAGFQGAVTEWRLWDVALTPAQIAAETLFENPVPAVIRHTMDGITVNELEEWRSPNAGTGGTDYDAIAGEPVTVPEFIERRDVATEWVSA